MAVSTVSGPIGLFDEDVRDKWSIQQVLKLAMFGHSQQFPGGADLATGGSTLTNAQAKKVRQLRTARAMLAHSMGRRAFDFRGVFQTSNADALASAFDLSAQSSVTFPTNSVRIVEMRMRSFNDADDFLQVVRQPVYGNDGTTPVLGDAKLIDAFMLDAGVYKQMGRVHLQTDEAMVEKTDGMSSSGIAGGALSSSVSAITFPPARALRVIGTHISQDAQAAATGSRAQLIDVEGDAATGTFDLAQVAGDDGAVADAPAGQVDVALELWPPSQVELVLNSTAVEVHLHSAINDVFQHEVEIYLEPAAPRTLLSS